MIVKRVTGTHSSIIMAINKLYGWSLRSLSVGRDQVFLYMFWVHGVLLYTRRPGSGWYIYRAKEEEERVFFSLVLVYVVFLAVRGNNRIQCQHLWILILGKFTGQPSRLASQQTTRAVRRSSKQGFSSRARIPGVSKIGVQNLLLHTAKASYDGSTEHQLAAPWWE